MTAESLLFVLVRSSAVIAAWIGTYAIHSTLLLALTWLIATRFVTSHSAREMLWKTALIGGIVTATIQSAPLLRPLGGRYDASALLERKIASEVPASRAVSTGPSTHIFAARLPDVAATLRLIPIALVLIWLGYALLVLGKVFVATRRARAQLGPRSEASAPALTGLFRGVLERFRIRKTVKLTVSSEVASPVVLGATEVCIPHLVTDQFTAEEQETVLAHEVAHLARKDPAWLLAAVTIESVLFFQPLNGVGRSRMQEESEYIADAMAVKTVGGGVILARCLTRVAEWMAGNPRVLIAPALMEQERSLLARVRNLVDRPRPERRLSIFHRALALALPLFVLIVAPAFISGGSRGWGKPAFHWEGAVAQGGSVEIKTLMGNVRAEPWTGNTVVVTATRHGRATVPDIAFAVVTHVHGVTICTVYPTPAGAPANDCGPGNAGHEFNTPANDVEIDYAIKVPRGVGFSARTSTGEISTGLLSAPVLARSMAGDIDVATESYASAASASGNVTVRMGRTDWRDSLAIVTNSGNIRVYLPAFAVTSISAVSRLESVDSDFNLKGKRVGFFERLKPRGSLGGSAFGIIGDRASIDAAHRTLRIESTAGGIKILQSIPENR